MAQGVEHSSYNKQVHAHFYQRFQLEYHTFWQAIQGISLEDERHFYTTLMLRRLMVLYFLQNKGLLDYDKSYLSNRLQLMQKGQGKDRFYHYHLIPLFHKFLCARQSDTPPFMGNIPVLALPLFQVHPIEYTSPSIQIPDDAFIQLFAFFDGYQWKLEGRTQNNNPDELYPEILGDIFEQQINQKHRGVYYTKEDVTTYIATNTLLPYLLHTLEAHFPQEFAPASALWQLLQDRPERYISMALQSEQYLPKETKREYEERRTRFHQLYTQLRTGKIHTIDALITCNLDIARFVQDTIAHCEKPELVLAFYRGMEQMSILDPTCGSGAFFCAAVNTLEPLYTICLQRLQSITDNDTHLSSSITSPSVCFHKEGLNSYHSLLKKVEEYATSRHFILNTILSNNLYGVDIMEEATALCQLRLFLTLVACSERIEDVPTFSSVQWNIATGNALTGSLLHDMKKGGFDVIIGNPPYVEYSKVKQEYTVQGYEIETCGNLYAAVLARALTLCRSSESYLGLIVPLSICGSERFTALRRTMTDQLARVWLANFEIFPSRLFEGAFQRLSIVIAQHRVLRPFEGTRVGASPCVRPVPDKRCVVARGRTQGDAPTLIRQFPSEACKIHTTKLQRWYAVERPYLINLMSYTYVQRSVKADVFPKLAAPLQEKILHKLIEKAQGQSIASLLSPRTSKHFVYYQEATNYWMKATCRVPFYKKNGVEMEPAHGRFLYFNDEKTARILMALMNSSLFYLWFATFSDGFHLSHTLIKEFPLGEDFSTIEELELLAIRLEEDITVHASMSTRNTQAHSIELEEYRMHLSKGLLDEIDMIVGRYYDLSEEELAFVVGYDGKYRMGRKKAERIK